MLGRQRRIDYEKFQISAIIRNNPGITTKELLEKLRYLDSSWTRLRIYRRLNTIDSIKRIRKFNKEINRFEYLYLIE